MGIMEDEKKIEELKTLYLEKGRHSQYQILASDLRDILGDCVPFKSKYEMERLDYIKENLNLKDKNILDIGGNTGYFTFEALKAGAKRADYYEGNKTHADFVTLAAEVLGLEKRINIHNEYYLAQEREKRYDVVFFLNVMHHLGYDFFGGGV